MPGLPMPLALHIASQVCDGLDYAHRHVGEDGRPMGLVHRDVSPDNVLISYEGQVKVIDFGIAKATSVVEARTSPGTLKGKYPYFSTEQARGQQDLDARSDVFAVGVVLYEMLCGRRPYEGELAAVLPRILKGDYARPSALNPAISPELETVMGSRDGVGSRGSATPPRRPSPRRCASSSTRPTRASRPCCSRSCLGHLFAEELAAEGRRIELTPAFTEMLADLQAQPRGEPTGVRPRPPTGGNRSGPGTNSGQRPALRTPSGTGGSSSRPALSRPSGGGSNGGMRSVSSASVRRVTSNSVPRTIAAPTRSSDRIPVATMVAPPDVTEGPATAVSKQVSVALQVHDTPVEVPAVRPSAMTDALRPLREAQAREEAERSERRQRLVLLISVPLFGLALLLGGLHYFMSGRSEELPKGSLWLTSKPPGASVKINGRDVSGVTPLVVKGVTLDEANTLILTLPGYRPWTKRFTPTSENEPPMHVELERLEPEPSATDTPKVTATDVPEATADGGTQTMADGGTQAVAAAPDAGPEAVEAGLKYNEVEYPTRLFVLRPLYNAVPMEKYGTASIELSPGASYSVSASGGVSLQKGRGGSTGMLAFYAEGDNVPVEESFGLLGAGSRTIKGARRLHVFMLDDDLSDNSGTMRVNLRQSQWVPPRQLAFDATRDALVLKPEHQLVLRGLNPDAIYLLTVRDDFAELRSGGKGRTRRVLCAESSQKSGRRNHRLLEAGKRYQLTGADTLRCTFPDSRVEDNAGALEVDIVDVTEMSRRERAAALRGASR